MGFISNLPGGMGVVELAMAALLTVLLGRNPEQVVVVTVLFRFATFWQGLAPACWFGDFCNIWYPW